eukprot:TRINITY_DN9680_c0_g1_i1.p1 TRINITY_DN9680_c0_g1~~TRINITY_DN9680_c0_g1_i1.p1  ORF type:complete len:286 (+),score=87.64 TRINITY_DN9680_c0_g1_i1:87-944(+)
MQTRCKYSSGRAAPTLCLSSPPLSVLASFLFFHAMASPDKKTLCLFDIDGTLAKAKKEMEPPMRAALAELRQKGYTVGVVGGSNMEKAKKQLGENYRAEVDFSFHENGLLAYRGLDLIHRQELKAHLGEERIKQLVNFTLHYIADLDLPVKRGTFVEFRTGMLNISPIGRNCSYEERTAFAALDAERQIRAALVQALQEKFASFGLRFVIGGQISIDVFPEGWDKTYCLQHVRGDNFDVIHFFGDKTKPGQNDYEIFSHPDTIGHHVDSPDHTLAQLQDLFGVGK